MQNQDAETNLSKATSDEGETPNESLLAGVTRSAASTLRHLGISSAALGGYIRKRAFLSIGSLAAKHGPEESVVSDKLSSRIAGKNGRDQRNLLFFFDARLSFC